MTVSKERLAEARARINAGWEQHKNAFVGKTDQEVRAIADQCFATADDLHKNCSIPTIEQYARGHRVLANQWNDVVVGYGETAALKFAFAAEEELRRRGSDLYPHPHLENN